MQAHVEWSGNRGVISFGWDRRALSADLALLMLRAEAPDEENLQRVEPCRRHLEQFGTGAQLTVTWPPPQGDYAQPAEKTTGRDTDARRHADGSLVTETLTTTPEKRGHSHG